MRVLAIVAPWNDTDRLFADVFSELPRISTYRLLPASVPWMGLIRIVVVPLLRLMVLPTFTKSLTPPPSVVALPRSKTMVPLLVLRLWPMVVVPTLTGPPGTNVVDTPRLTLLLTLPVPPKPLAVPPPMMFTSPLVMVPLTRSVPAWISVPPE